MFCSIRSVVLYLLVATFSAGVASDDSLSPFERTLLKTMGPWPQEPASDPGNEYSGIDWAEQLGKLLFADTQLSANGQVACITCHQPARGFSDGLPVSLGAARHHRNSQGLLDVGLQRWFGWDGGADSLWSASLRPLFSKIEMNQTVEGAANYLRSHPVYGTALLRSPSVHRSVSQERIDDEMIVVRAAKMIAAYVRTLQSVRTSFDRFRDSVLAGQSRQHSGFSAAALRGFKIFAGDANCHVCHFGPNFSNGEFHDTGRPFFIGVGQVDAGRYTGIQRMRADRYNLLGPFNARPVDEEQRKTRTVRLSQHNWGQWRTPSLRNLTMTAPYMHDGSLQTLRAVVDAYADIDMDRLHVKGESILKPLDLSEAQREDLVAFLMSLSATSEPLQSVAEQ